MSADAYVICKVRRAAVGAGKHAWHSLEQARAVAQQMLLPRSQPNARLLIYAVPLETIAIFALDGCDTDERWRVAEATFAVFVERVTHPIERVVTLTEELMVNSLQRYRARQMREGQAFLAQQSMIGHKP